MKACRPGEENLLGYKVSVRMGRKVDFIDSGCFTVVGTCVTIQQGLVARSSRDFDHL